MRDRAWRGRDSHRDVWALMSTALESEAAATVVHRHRQHYLDRKLAKSPLLHFAPGSHRVDVCELFKDVQANLPVKDLGQAGVSEPKGMLRGLLEGRMSAIIHGVRLATVKKLERMQKAALDNLHSTGQHSLYLGYPCLVMPIPGRAAKFAPVLLFAVRLTLSNQKVTIDRIRGGADDGKDDAADAVVNRLLASFVKRIKNFALNVQDHRLEVDGPQIDGEVTRMFAPWVGVQRRDRTYPNVTEVASSTLRQLVGTSDPYIADHAILGLAEFSGQAMLDDLDTIETELRSGTPCPSALSQLIMVRNSVETGKPVVPASDGDRWLVERSDESQESVVWAQRAGKLVVLQGPPGTGKSQTIVNIVADALAHRKSVMVVCQKRAAIEVVKKRLAAVGLGEFCVLVDDVDKDRLPVIRRLDAIEGEFPTMGVWAREWRTDSANEIMRTENRIDRAIDALNFSSEDRRPRYGDIQAHLTALDRFDANPSWSSGLIRAVAALVVGRYSQDELERFLRRCASLDGEMVRLRYGENLWSAAAGRLAADQQAVLRLGAQARTANSFGNRLASRDCEIYHDASTQWFVEHPWLQANDELLPLASLVPGHGRQNFEDFRQWLRALRAVASEAETVNVDVLTRGLHHSALDVAFLKKLCTDAEDLGDLARLNADIEKEAIWRAAQTCLQRHRGHWCREIHAAALHAWRDDLLASKGRSEGIADLAMVESWRDGLAKELGRKRGLDTADILEQYQGRVSARFELKQRNLLRLRAGAGARKTSLRSLYSHGLTGLRQIAPVLLVSPETASSILPMKGEIFDLAVIDEASQMFVAEAIPMLFRAKQAVIAGDKHQMPPTDFFAYSDEQDGADELSADSGDVAPEVQSAAAGEYRLLEAAEAAVPKGTDYCLSLNVHYRSARKELIDFSNQAFYRGELSIPSGNAPLLPFMRTAIEFDEVNGMFQSGVNEDEAKRIVELLSKIWSVPAQSRPTVGVIVVNVKQRDCVNDLLQSRATRDERFGQAFAEELARRVDDEDVSFFVRSVEHVQGDERDLILFGLTYSGTRRALGPLNIKEDGRKRLNVAITRAKRGMIVLNSLRISHLSNAAEGRGAGELERYYVWQYLRYARAIAQGQLGETEAATVLAEVGDSAGKRSPTLAMTESPFEDDVKAFVESLGLHVDAQVGESKFRIDLGVKSSPNVSGYLCGIECDGARYHETWRARIRDVWRQEILESKGWTIVRVWSTDWYERTARTKVALEQRLRELDNLRTSQPAVAATSFIRVPTVPSDAPIGEETVAHAVGRIVANSVGHKRSGPTAPIAAARTIGVDDLVTYEVVGQPEQKVIQIIDGQTNTTAKPALVNVRAPLAQAMLGASAGDEVVAVFPRGDVALIIRAVERLGSGQMPLHIDAKG